MVVIDKVDLEPGTIYTPEELRSIFGKQRAGKGIEHLYDENDNEYIRLFSKKESEYGDNLEAKPMRYVGEKDFNNPQGDQQLNRGNGALAKTQNNDWPVFLFEKVSERPVKHLYHGRVEVVDYELNYRPQKAKKEYDFYLDVIGEDADSDSIEGESDDDLAPGPLREIDTDSREIPEAEQKITYESNKKSQAQAANEHEDTVEQLRERLESGRWNCWETDETDILATSDSEALVVEVKSVDGSNERRQIRKALGQLFENCYRDVHSRGWSDKEIIPCLAFSRAPRDKFSGYLEFLQSKGIATLWRGERDLAGHPNSVERVLR